MIPTRTIYLLLVLPLFLPQLAGAAQTSEPVEFQYPPEDLGATTSRDPSDTPEADLWGSSRSSTIFGFRTGLPSPGSTSSTSPWRTHSRAGCLSTTIMVTASQWPMSTGISGTTSTSRHS